MSRVTRVWWCKYLGCDGCLIESIPGTVTVTVTLPQLGATPLIRERLGMILRAIALHLHVSARTPTNKRRRSNVIMYTARTASTHSCKANWRLAPRHGAVSLTRRPVRHALGQR